MSYIRKMNDGSEKVYFSSDEMKKKLHKSILELWNELVDEISGERSSNKNYIKNKDTLIYNKENLCTV